MTWPLPVSDGLRDALLGAGSAPRRVARCAFGESVWDEDGVEWDRCHFEAWVVMAAVCVLRRAWDVCGDPPDRCAT